MKALGKKGASSPSNVEPRTSNAASFPSSIIERRTSNPVCACRLYGIIDSGYLSGRDPVDLAGQMIEGGVDFIQLRAKGWSSAEVSAAARRIYEVTRSAQVPFVINDYLEIAAEGYCDGVHIGQDDVDVALARERLGPSKLIGKSTHSLLQALHAQEEAIDYIGVGPVFATPTKPTYVPVGLELVQEVTGKIRIPFFCIGGIKLENAAQVLAAGATRIVVVSGILQAANPAAYCRDLKGLLR